MGKERMHKKTLWLIGSAFLIIIVCFIFLQLPEDKIIFSFSDKLGFWQASEGTIIEQETGSVRITKGPGDFFVLIPQINLNADYYDGCILEMELPIAYDQGGFIFLSPYYIKEEKSILNFDTGTARFIQVSLSRDHGVFFGWQL